MQSVLKYINSSPNLVDIFIAPCRLGFTKFILIFAMLFAFESLAFGGEFSENQSCEKAKITELLKEAENSNLGSLPHDTVNSDFSSIAEKYKFIGCDIASLMINLNDAGFKLSKVGHYRTYADLKLTAAEIKLRQQKPHFFASIDLHQDHWLRIGEHIFQIEIEYENGRVKFVKALIIYMYL